MLHYVRAPPQDADTKKSIHRRKEAAELNGMGVEEEEESGRSSREIKCRARETKFIPLARAGTQREGELLVAGTSREGGEVGRAETRRGTRGESKRAVAEEA